MQTKLLNWFLQKSDHVGKIKSFLKFIILSTNAIGYYNRLCARNVSSINIRSKIQVTWNCFMEQFLSSLICLLHIIQHKCLKWKCMRFIDCKKRFTKAGKSSSVAQKILHGVWPLWTIVSWTANLKDSYVS